MKILLFLFLFVAHNEIDIHKIAQINRHKKSAEEAYAAKQYEEAVRHYKILSDSLYVREDPLLYNLGNAYMQLADTSNARQTFSMLTASKDKNVQSLAFQQLGYIQQGSKNYQQALNLFKNSLKANPANEQARYNYELLKKLLDQQQEQDQDDQNKDQDQQDDQQDQDQQDDQQDQDQQDDQQQEQDQDEQQQEEGDQEKDEGSEGKPEDTEEEGQEQEQMPDPEISRKLEEMDMTEDRARMILDALRNREIQYIQQNPRKPESRPPSGKPDW